MDTLWNKSPSAESRATSLRFRYTSSVVTLLETLRAFDRENSSFQVMLKLPPAWCFLASHSRKAITATVDVLLKKLKTFINHCVYGVSGRVPRFEDECH
jgi:hypothetical protein